MGGHLHKGLIVFSLLLLCLSGCRDRATIIMMEQLEKDSKARAASLPDPKKIFVLTQTVDSFAQSDADKFKQAITNGLAECKVSSMVVVLPTNDKKLTLEDDPSIKNDAIRLMDQFQPDYILEARPRSASGRMVTFDVKLALASNRTAVWGKEIWSDPTIFNNVGDELAKNILKQLKSSYFEILRNCGNSSHN